MQKTSEHWALQHEAKGGYHGLKIMMFLYDIGGKHLFKMVLYPVMFIYYLLSATQRKNSEFYLALVNESRIKHGLEPRKLFSFKHFLSFADMILDKINAWRGNIRLNIDTIYTQNSEETFNTYKNNTGKMIICSHLGNIEVLRALGVSGKYNAPNVYSIIFTDHAKNVNSFINSVCKKNMLNVIPTTSIGPQTAIELKEIIDKGKNNVIAIVGDRISLSSNNSGEKNRVCTVKFLGKDADFPQGAFILASVLKCPVQLLFALKNEETGKIDIICSDFADQIILSRKNRETDLKNYIQKYADQLEYYAIRYPYQWFNFYKFFK